MKLNQQLIEILKEVRIKIFFNTYEYIEEMEVKKKSSVFINETTRGQFVIRRTDEEDEDLLFKNVEKEIYLGCTCFNVQNNYSFEIKINNNCKPYTFLIKYKSSLLAITINLLENSTKLRIQSFVKRR